MTVSIRGCVPPALPFGNSCCSSERRILESGIEVPCGPAIAGRGMRSLLQFRALWGPMERRSGKDRRQFTDPRFANQAYPEFVDRRKGGDRRRLDYQHIPGHPVRKWVVLIGGLVVVLLVALFFALSMSLRYKSTYKTVRRKTITLGQYQHDRESHTRATLPLSPL
jgi:hypothetical protein